MSQCGEDAGCNAKELRQQLVPDRTVFALHRVTSLSCGTSASEALMCHAWWDVRASLPTSSQEGYPRVQGDMHDALARAAGVCA